MIEFTSLAEVAPEEIDDGDARAAGHPSAAALLAELGGRPGGLYRVGVRRAGPDPRAALREAVPGEGELAALVAELARMDARARRGPWTAEVLAAIDDHPPGTRASALAAALGRETPPFKADVRRLKEPGLTESLTTGYRLSPRGRAVLTGLS